MLKVRARDGQTVRRLDGQFGSESTVRPSDRLTVLVGVVSLILAGCGKSGGPTPLVVYSTHGRDQLTAMEKAFEAANPDIDVHWLDMGSQDAFDRVRSERANPQGDVWFGGPSTMFLKAAADSLLQVSQPTWGAGMAGRGRDPHGFRD